MMIVPAGTKNSFLNFTQTQKLYWTQYAHKFRVFKTRTNILVRISIVIITKLYGIFMNDYYIDEDNRITHEIIKFNIIYLVDYSLFTDSKVD